MLKALYQPGDVKDMNECGYLKVNKIGNRAYSFLKQNGKIL